MVRTVTIVYSDSFIDITDDLIRILYQQNYFGFIDEAEDYVDRIYDFIRDNISTRQAKNTPTNLKQYGERYICYIANQRTSWYIFFTHRNGIYYVDFITNNHTGLVSTLNL